MNKGDIYLPTTMLDEVATAATVVQVTQRVNTMVGELRNDVYWLKKDDNWKLAYAQYETWASYVLGEIKTPRQTVEHWVEEEEVRLGLTEANRSHLKPAHLRALSAAPPAEREEILAAARQASPVNHFTGKGQLSAKVIEEVIQKRQADLAPPVIVLPQLGPKIIKTNEDGSYVESIKVRGYGSVEVIRPAPAESTDVQEAELVTQPAILMPDMKRKKLIVTDADDTVLLEINRSSYPALAEYLFRVASASDKKHYLSLLTD
jgi:hypothetical protein